ncbi:putative anti-sigma regulatory factor, serine/threonine protein kinase [uncultured Desulfatiglans sp.]|nr:putative anti-sigma regulatory factor, serine/threonine protein kinase [uncultured Desulfatiglans sp.]
MITEGERHMVSSEKGRITLPAALENLEDFKEFIVVNAEKAGLDPQKTMEMELAADEILTNIISYAYQGASGDITVTCGTDEEGRFVVETADAGEPFDPLLADIPDVSASLEQREIGGLGLFLVKKMVDETRYERRNARNILRLYKKV